MHSGDPLCDNLLIRLFSYTPRVGRQALEDYCTEALAWCLRRSPSLLKVFLNLTEVPTLRDWQEPAEVHTQMRYDGADTDDSDEDVFAGRFDLVIESGLVAPFVLVVESKVGSDVGENQLQTYRNRLNQRDAFEGVPKTSRHLVTLTTLPYKSAETDGSITWPDVQSAIARGPDVNDALICGVFEQFASFLKEKGLAMLQLNKTDEKLLAQWLRVKELEGQLRSIVERLRNQREIKPMVGRKQVKSKDGWIGIYGKNDFWAGFGIAQTQTAPELYMWIEITVPGDRRKWIQDFDTEVKSAFSEGKRYLKVHEDSDAVNFNNLSAGSSRFVFAKPVTGDLDGKGEAVFKWLYERSKFAIGLAEHGSVRRKG
jgi:hypothetical protein